MSAAQAADLAARHYTKAPVMATVYDWTGFYVGVNAGVGLGRNPQSYLVPGDQITTTVGDQILQHTAIPNPTPEAS